jgi:LPS export ABC transporter protein LptC
MDDAGALQYRIRAAESLHYPDDSLRLSGIDVAYVGGARGPWRLTAPRGRASPGTPDTRLEGGVVLSHQRDADTGLRLTTDYVWIRPESERIDTAAAVAATLAEQQAWATGMTAYLDSNRLRLHHDVRVIYAP